MKANTLFIVDLCQTIFLDNIMTVWERDEEKYYVSVVDVLTDRENPRTYWKVLKHRLKQEENESVTSCNRLKFYSTINLIKIFFPFFRTT